MSSQRKWWRYCLPLLTATAFIASVQGQSLQGSSTAKLSPDMTVAESSNSADTVDSSDATVVLNSATEATSTPSLLPETPPLLLPSQAKSVTSESATSTSLSSSDSALASNSQQQQQQPKTALPLMSSTFPTTTMKQQSALNQSTTAATATTTTSNSHLANAPTFVNSANGDTRLRWVDFRRHQQAYPPRMPVVPGIPSGFRNPIANPSTASAFTTSTTSASPSSTTNAPQPTGSMYNPGAHHAFFGGSSSNPVGFGGSVIMEDDPPPFKAPNPNRRYNITRVEHIAAECSDEYMKVVVRFNGTFTGLVYSSGYVHDPNCIYVNGSGRSYYEFFIRLNQCGTLGRQEMYHPTMPGEARRRDQLMWNTLSIQYNAMIEEEFDEHFRLTCEYGSDFWKTVTFPSVNVEINTGSPVVFTVNPPQCQMEIRRGFGIAGSRTSGSVTVGDPLTLLIHMKSEKAGFDILVKNCVAHNGAQQRMQLIDSNGCVTNDKLISPFRGTYNSESGHQVSLYSYLKAFRFTGSPALYLGCDIHICANKCPPQRCYWRNLSKRSADLKELDEKLNGTSKSALSESISLYQALEVYHEQDGNHSAQSAKSDLNKDLVCLRSSGLVLLMFAFIGLMSISLGVSICFCLRMRGMKHLQRNLQTARNFGSEYSVSRCSSSECSAFSDKHQRNLFARLR